MYVKVNRLVGPTLPQRIRLFRLGISLHVRKLLTLGFAVQYDYLIGFVLGISEMACDGVHHERGK